MTLGTALEAEDLADPAVGIGKLLASAGRGPWGRGPWDGRGESGKCKTGGETAGGLFLPELRQDETKLSDVHDLQSRVGRASDVED